MASTTQQTGLNTPAHAEGHRKLKAWTTRFHAALSDAEGYAKLHHGLFREFEGLSDEVRGSTKRSIIPYVEAIMNHTASQGYQESVHYEPLFKGLSAYCTNLPPPLWIAPPDQFSKSPSPTLPPPPPAPRKTMPTIAANRTIPPRPVPKKPSQIPAPVPHNTASPSPHTNEATTKGKGRADKPIKRDGPSTVAADAIHVKHLPKGKKRAKQSKEFVELTTDAEKDSSDEEKKPPGQVNQKEPVKCVTCERDGHPCMTNPSTVGNVSPACYECFQRKRKCSLCLKPAGESRKKKTAVTVAAGAPGELTSK